MSGKSIFITGGSGYIGSTVIEFAIAKGYKVTALSRRPESDTHLTSIGATPVRGDLKSLEVLTREAAKADVVINIADSISSDFGKIVAEERFAINNGAIDALADGMKGSGKALVLTAGTLFSAADPEGKETDENSPGWPKDHPFYSDIQERNLKYKDDGIRVCYLRLAPYVYGRGGSGVKLYFQNFAKTGAGMYIDDGKAVTTTVHVEDAARLYLLVAEKGKAGEKYNATSENNITQGQLAETIAKKLDVPCHSMPFKDAVAKMGDWFAAFMAAENKGSNRKAREELGWEIKAPKGILEEIGNGSYEAVANDLKKSAA